MERRRIIGVIVMVEFGRGVVVVVMNGSEEIRDNTGGIENVGDAMVDEGIVILSSANASNVEASSYFAYLLILLGYRFLV